MRRLLTGLALALALGANAAEATSSTDEGPVKPQTVKPQTVKPCVTASAACTGFIPLGEGAARSMVYRSFDLDQRNPRITRALIMVHGTLRNADHYFQTAAAAGFLAGALDNTLIIAPAFHSAAAPCDDKLEPDEVSWSCVGDSWRSGGAAASIPGLYSFDLTDALLKRLADKRLFPNLKVIVIAGHSAGGQFVNRYEMASRVADDLGVQVRFVIANPSSYAWPAATRLIPEGVGSVEAAHEAWKDETKAQTGFAFGPFDAAKAPGYDRWPYGLEHRDSGYTVGLTDDQLRAHLVSRRATYVLSQVDVLPLGGFDGSPDAMAQGATRRQRGEAFVDYLHTALGGDSPAIIVPECGHNDRCVFTTDAVLPVIFPAS